MFGTLRHRSATTSTSGGDGATSTDIEMDTINLNASNASSTSTSNNNHALENNDANKNNSIIDAVKLEILGAPHQGWRQFFYMLDPYKQGEYYVICHDTYWPNLSLK
jgi:hypothetical protein